MLLTDPAFYAVALPAVILVGLSKGGLGGAMALMGVPLMSLVMPPFQAAAILLPVLLAMDAIALWTWRGYFDRRTLVLMLPAGCIGIAVAWLTVTMVSEAMVRLLVGLVAALFVLRHVSMSAGARVEKWAHRPVLAGFWGSIAGFTSFVAHAGGPPYQVYTLPLNLDPKTYTGTSVIYFAAINVLKVLPYFLLGQMDWANMTAAAVLVPVAIAATLAGAFVVKHMRAEIFYPLMYTMVGLVALKLIWDGISGLAGG